MTMRSDFEKWYSDDGESPKAIKRSPNGEYEYLGAAGAWIAWRAAVIATLEKAAVFFEEDENYWVCVDDRGETIDTPQVELRKMAQDIEWSKT